MCLGTLHKGLKHLIKEAGPELQWMSDHAIWISIGVGLVAMIAARFYLARKLRGDYRLSLGDQLERVEMALAPIVVLTSCCVAFSHGANDVANSVGPLAAVVDIVNSGEIPEKVPVPFWVLCLGGIGIVAGLAAPASTRRTTPRGG